jgi:hypothetical protein
MMCLKQRFEIINKNPLFPGIEFDVFDWDRRQTVSFYSSSGCFMICGNKELRERAARCLDDLPEGMNKVTFDVKGHVFSSDVSSNDKKLALPYPKYSPADFPADCRTIKQSSLNEIRRLAHGVDVVSYPTGTDNTPRVVIFKYKNSFRSNDRPAAVHAWNEIQALVSLPRDHPGFINFDALVLSPDNHIIGFTTERAAGCDLDHADRNRFSLTHLRYLLDAIDHLHIDLNMTHGALLSRNMIYKSRTRALRLCDFEWAMQHDHHQCAKPPPCCTNPSCPAYAVRRHYYRDIFQVVRTAVHLALRDGLITAGATEDAVFARLKTDQDARSVCFDLSCWVLGTLGTKSPYAKVLCI